MPLPFIWCLIISSRAFLKFIKLTSFFLISIRWLTSEKTFQNVIAPYRFYYNKNEHSYQETKQHAKKKDRSLGFWVIIIVQPYYKSGKH
jgi:hypothetical protein